jgi:hypothetical protein
VSGMVWAAGDNVPPTNPRQLLGTVATFPGVDNEHHLHLDFTGTAADRADPSILRPIGDPLAFLTAIGDVKAPTVSARISISVSPTMILMVICFGLTRGGIST